MNAQKTNWWLDAILFLGFIVTYLMDITGVVLHQWIGILVAILVLVHLVRHADWITTVLTKFFGKTSNSARLNLVIDGGIGLGFSLIIFTGLIISTWLNLTFIDYAAWRNFHILTSVFTLFALLLKIVLHRKWIVCVAEKYIFSHSQQAGAVPALVSVQTPIKVNRREFLKVSALVGAGAFIGVSQIHKVFEDAVLETSGNANLTSNSLQANSTANLPVSQPTAVIPAQATSASVPTAAIQPTAVPTAAEASNQAASSNCRIQCNRGCSFPGHCRRYTDSNGNGKCDLGECL
jgi:hypothetical protein